MAVLSDLKQRRHQLGSSRSIRSLLERRWWVVVLALMLTGLGAALTGVLFKAGLKLLGGWRLELMAEYPAWMVLPCLGGVGGLVSGLLVSRLAPAAGGSGITYAVKVQDSSDNSSFADVSGAAFTTTTANTALVESLTINTDEIKRYARAVITVAGGTGAGAVSVVGLGRKKYN